MDFFQTIRDIIVKELFLTYFSGICPFCESKNYIILDTRHRILPDMGGPTRRIKVDLEVKTVQCANCKRIFTPEHPYYPPFLHYTLDVVQFALDAAHKWTLSAEKIAHLLETEHQVMVDPKTIQEWINSYSEQYFQTYFLTQPKTAVQEFKSITVDGVYFTAGKDVIGKKKNVESLSVTKLAGDVYLVTWWE